MSVDIVGNAHGWWQVAPLWWFVLAEYADHVLPNVARKCRRWYTSELDGLDEDHALELAAGLQRSIDDCSIDRYARQLFAALRSDKDFSCLVEYDGGGFYLRPDERRFVDQFVGEVQRFVCFLLSCKGFQIM
ncbi:hypothetical protein [Bradyrhizobium diazoefficiens]|uniref:hypothetical protein n=1 Tax=Bradyrhizobium diazoefficiens TaxID=1355477 RepID=UPI00272D4D58|nr:hypothetical protein [Bradyrhizobium diazoefficiens]WLA68556.1 hypothetical protein QNN01_18975 [Bradyrhizobium diazoefficiens]